MKRELRHQGFTLHAEVTFPVYDSDDILEVCTFKREGFLNIQIIKCSFVARAIKDFDFGFLKNVMYFTDDRVCLFLYDLSSIVKKECFIEERKYFLPDELPDTKQQLRLDKYSNRGYKFLKFSEVMTD